jgi:exoribonuclease-2
VFQLRLQEELDRVRHTGALNIDRVEAEAVILDGQIAGINTRKKIVPPNSENFKVAANGVMAQTLLNAGVSSIRRVVKTPVRWPRIVELAARSWQ